jgi:hypothetical protein
MAMTMQAMTAKDMRTVGSGPMTAYCLGWNDAYYQAIYYNPYRQGTQAQREYEDGHHDGSDARVLPANMGG